MKEKIKKNNVKMGGIDNIYIDGTIIDNTFETSKLDVDVIFDKCSGSKYNKYTLSINFISEKNIIKYLNDNINNSIHIKLILNSGEIIEMPESIIAELYYSSGISLGDYNGWKSKITFISTDLLV